MTLEIEFLSSCLSCTVVSNIAIYITLINIAVYITLINLIGFLVTC